MMIPVPGRRAAQLAGQQTTLAMRGLNDLVAQFHIERTGVAHMAVGITAQPHKGACVAFRHAVFNHHVSYGLAFDLWG
jgi:hypothetical protein